MYLPLPCNAPKRFYVAAKKVTLRNGNNLKQVIFWEYKVVKLSVIRSLMIGVRLLTTGQLASALVYLNNLGMTSVNQKN